MKTRAKAKGKPSRRVVKSPSNRRRMVKTLAAKGLSGDVIAARLGVNKNFLRAEYALDLHAGREIKWADKAAADAAELPRWERERLKAIKGSFQSHWYSPEHGNLLFGFTHTVEEALAWCKQYGDRWD
jgi:hypothetical protein